jgi:hypothetical protein
MLYNSCPCVADNEPYGSHQTRPIFVSNKGDNYDITDSVPHKEKKDG